MSEEVEVQAPQAAPEGTTAPETPASEQTADLGEQQTPETPVESTEEHKEEAPKRDPWYLRRIDEVTKARREAERERDALRAMLDAGKTTPETPQQLPDVQRLAEQIAEQTRLTEASNRVYEQGKSAHPDFDVAVRQIVQVADLSQRPDFIEAVTSLPNAPEVYYFLGKNPDEAAHVLSLTPVKMAIELAKVSAQVGRPKAQSKAPAPISPVGKSAAPSADLSDDLPIDEWMKRREAMRQKR